MKTMKMKLLAMMAVMGVLSLADTAVADHLAKTPGTWKLVSAEREGKLLPKEDIANVTVTVSKAEGDALKLVVKDGDKIVSEATAKLHKPGDKHDEFDSTYTKGSNKEGDLKGKTLHGIITVDGDTMKVCWHGGKDHPKEHTGGGKDTDCTLRTYKRVK